ncbi:PepSY-associated TM helix domain-containing protein [Bordetella genomosp. 13]|uniref:PepSY-associated TM helix domain-containing protein n=1 Tax=Bordetella genomosp. 13 TaxID=463040 RepID=UPI0021B622A4|nr:PepSY-associated TM helix domain-containing protein [Bordetella genomosp. 13]
MSWLHTWSGLIFGWVLFAMFLTGTLAFFRPEITRWMQPEISVHAVSTAQSVAVAERFLREKAPDATRWFISPSSPREPAILLTYQIPKPPPGQRAFKRAVLDPQTGQELALRDTRGGEFFYRFHFELEMGYPWGRWLASIAGMFMLLAIISGIITHKKIFADFFTFRPGKGGQRAWMDGHNVLSVLGLPFHLMITFSGVLLFATMLLPAGILASYDNERQFFDEAFPAFAVSKASGKPAELLPLAPLVAKAQADWQGGRVGRVVVSQPGDAAATVSIGRASSERVSYGRLAPTITYSGVDGHLISRNDAQSGAATTAGTIIGLHLGLYAEPLLRWFYFVVSMAGTAMVGSGLVLWIAKRRQKLKAGAPDTFSLRVVDALNAGTIAGLGVACAAFFWANRVLPAGLPDHGKWETRAFFISWGACYLYAFVRGRGKWRELLWAAAVLLMALPVVNALTTSRHLGVSLPAGDWVMAGFDLTVLVCGGLMAWIAYRAGRARPAAARAGARPRAGAPGAAAAARAESAGSSASSASAAPARAASVASGASAAPARAASAASSPRAQAQSGAAPAYESR